VRRYSRRRQIDVFRQSDRIGPDDLHHFYWTTPGGRSRTRPSPPRRGAGAQGHDALSQDKWAAQPNLTFSFRVRGTAKIIDARGRSRSFRRTTRRLPASSGTPAAKESQALTLLRPYYEQIPMDWYPLFPRARRASSTSPDEPCPMHRPRTTSAQLGDLRLGFTDRPTEPCATSISTSTSWATSQVSPTSPLGSRRSIADYAEVIEDFLCADDARTHRQHRQGIMKRVFTSTTRRPSRRQAKRTYKGFKVDVTSACRNKLQGSVSTSTRRSIGNFDGSMRRSPTSAAIRTSRSVRLL